MRKYFNLTISELTENLTEGEYDYIMDHTLDGIELQPYDDMIPLPPNYVVSVEDGMFTILGDIGQQGMHKGYAKIGIPLEWVKKYFGVTVSFEVRNPEEDIDSWAVLQILKSRHWIEENKRKKESLMFYYTKKARESAMESIKGSIEAVSKVPGTHLSYLKASQTIHYLTVLLNALEKEAKEQEER